MRRCENTFCKNAFYFWTAIVSQISNLRGEFLKLRAQKYFKDYEFVVHVYVKSTILFIWVTFGFLFTIAIKKLNCVPKSICGGFEIVCIAPCIISKKKISKWTYSFWTGNQMNRNICWRKSKWTCFLSIYILPLQNISVHFDNFCFNFKQNHL